MSNSKPRVLVTRPKEGVGRLKDLLVAYGMEVLCLPAIEVLPLEDYSDTDLVLKRLEEFQWLVFTSANGVRFFFNRWKALYGDKSLPELSIACIGPGTARALSERGLKVDLIPSNFKSEDLALALIERNVQGKKVLLARAKGARDVLSKVLEEAGALVLDLAFYRVERPNEDSCSFKELLKEKIDIITFTSSQTVKNFFELTEGHWPEGAVAACIGPITARTYKDIYGTEATIIASVYTIEGLVSSIIEFLRGGKRCVSQQHIS